MEHARKFVLVAQDAPFSHPATQAVSEMDTEMSKILNSKGDDRTKWLMYSQLLQRFQNFKKELTEPKHDILESVPIKYKSRASKLLNSLPNSVTWTQDGETSVNGTVISGSHIADLVTAAVNPTKKRPVGWTQFHTVLPEYARKPSIVFTDWLNWPEKKVRFSVNPRMQTKKKKYGKRTK